MEMPWSAVLCTVWITYSYHILTGVSLDFVDEYLVYR